MKEDFAYFAKHYLVLLVMMGLGFAGMWWYREDRQLAQLWLWATIGGYTAWGVVHHLIRKDLTAAIVMEYFLIGLVAGILIQSTLLS